MAISSRPRLTAGSFLASQQLRGLIARHDFASTKFHSGSLPELRWELPASGRNSSYIWVGKGARTLTEWGAHQILTSVGPTLNVHAS